MSIEEKRDEIIEEYHCQDVHGELCGDCAECRECLKDDLLKLENLVKTEVIDEFVRRLNLKFVELPLDELIVLDIMKEINRVAKQMKGEEE